MSAVQDNEEAQRNGFVSIVYSSGLKDDANALRRGRLELGLQSSFLLEAIPYKVRGFHFCQDSPLLHPLMAITQRAVGSKIRLRTRIHHGKSE
jgi:hypothetical protein